MNELILRFDDLPFMPRNRSHMLTVSKGRPMNIKTPLARAFEEDVRDRMHKYAKEVNAFRLAFHDKLHYIKATYIIHTPYETLITKDGRISSKTTDLDSHKCLQDSIFEYMGMDDKLIRDVKYFSPVSHDGLCNFGITYKLEPLCKLTNISSSTQNTQTQMNEDSESSALL